MKKLATLSLCVAMLFNSCAATFGTVGNQTEQQRKNDKMFSRILLGSLIIVGSVIVINESQKQ